MTGRLVVAGLLLAHGLIHLAFVAPRPAPTPGGPPWPFDLGQSWLLAQLGVSADLARILGLALVAATVAGFALAALTAIAIGPAGLWTAGLALGGVASLGVLILFFHPWLVLGLAIDAVVLWAAIVARWAPEGVTP
jgi:hypothetical protein